MSNGQVSKGRLLQIKQGYSNGNPIPSLENGEFGLVLDENQEELYIGSNSGNIQVVTERNIGQLAVQNGSISRTELDGEVNALLDNISSVTNIPEATASQKGLMSSNDKTKLNSIETGANNTTIINSLTSLSTTSALSAYQGKLLKDMVDAVGSGGSTTIDETKYVFTDGTKAMDSITIGTRKSGTTVGTNSFAQGNNITASGNSSHAEGYYTKASGNMSHAEGYETTSSGNYSHAEGYCTTASGNYSHSEGSYTAASGYYSHASGYGTNANVYASHAIGQYNETMTGDETEYSSTADAFVIGNGTSYINLSNAFRVTFGGATYGKMAFNSTGADYAEYFEWLDSNENDEDRVGYVVTLDGDKIRKANENDTYILGIVSANPSVLGDSYQDDWCKRYVTDEWGRFIYETVTVEDELGTHEETHIKSNPDWNNETEYIPREQRKEWDAIGLVGKLYVRDDGTCQVNGFAKVGVTDGVLTHSDEMTNMRVMERVAPNIVRVFIK